MQTTAKCYSICQHPSEQCTVNPLSCSYLSLPIHSSVLVGSGRYFTGKKVLNNLVFAGEPYLQFDSPRPGSGHIKQWRWHTTDLIRPFSTGCIETTYHLGTGYRPPDLAHETPVQRPSLTLAQNELYEGHITSDWEPTKYIWPMKHSHDDHGPYSRSK